MNEVLDCRDTVGERCTVTFEDQFVLSCQAVIAVLLNQVDDAQRVDRWIGCELHDKLLGTGVGVAANTALTFVLSRRDKAN